MNGSMTTRSPLRRTQECSEPVAAPKAASAPKESAKPSAAPLKAGSKIPPLSDDKPRFNPSSSPAASTATSASAMNSEPAMTVLVPNLESKGSTTAVSNLDSQLLSNSSSDHRVASAAAASVSVPDSAGSASSEPPLSPRAERRRRQKAHKGATSDALLSDYRALLASRGPDRDFEAKHDLFVAQQVQSSKANGTNLPDVLDKMWTAYPQPRPLTFFHQGVFSRELIGVAFNSNSVEQAVKRLIDFRARVAKLASLPAD